MTDEPTVTLTYNGPPVRSVELDIELRDGDTVEVSEGLAGTLLCGSGFSGGPDHIQPPPEGEPPPPSGQRLTGPGSLEEEIAANAGEAVPAPAPTDETSDDLGSGPLAERTLEELQALARTLELEGYSSLNKDDLVEELEEELASSGNDS